MAYQTDTEKGEVINISSDYKVKGFPTILFFNSDGKLIGKEEGFMDGERFIYIMEKYLKKATK